MPSSRPAAANQQQAVAPPAVTEQKLQEQQQQPPQQQGKKEKKAKGNFPSFSCKFLFPLESMLSFAVFQLQKTNPRKKTNPQQMTIYP